MVGAVLAGLALPLAHRRAARAEPLVRIRAESRIELGVSQLSNGVVISGALRDELGQPLADRPLAIQATPLDKRGRPHRRTLPTDALGRFELTIADTEHDYRLLATFAGDRTHRGVRVERKLERQRADVRLELRIPAGGVLELDREEISIQVVAESDAGGGNIRMRLSNETGQTLAAGRTGQDGRLELRVDPGVLGPPGPGLLRIESAPDARRAEAQTESRVVRQRRIQVTLEAMKDEFEAGSEIEVHGTVSTSEGPRAAIPVGLFARGSHAETVMSDADGKFAASLWLSAEPGTLPVSARIEADATHPPSEARIDIVVRPATPLPLSWLLGALAAAAASLGWLARGRIERGASTAEPMDTESVVATVAQAPRQTRRADRFRIAGRAVDLRDGHPVAKARVQLIDRTGRLLFECFTDADGQFCSPDMPAGAMLFRLHAEGYVAAQAAVGAPHRGEWTDFQIRLESLRARALSPFRKLALRLLPSPRVWGVWTDREVLGWAKREASGRVPDIGPLTLRVEQACYGDPGPSPDEVLAIEQEAATIEAELDRRDAS